MDQADQTFEAVLQKVHGYLPGENPEVLKKAYLYSRQAHAQQLRAGGDLYITHPLAVTDILCDLHLDLPTLAAGLLHDVLEDTAVTRENLTLEFGPEIGHLVEGVTKIDVIEQQTLEQDHDPKASTPELARQAENWRKMLIATAQDIRVIFLKLADRLHNMTTLSALPPEKQKRISEETLTLYAPLAQRLGMYRLKSNLEDLCLRHLEPQAYAELEKKINDSQPRREEFVRRAQSTIEALVAQHPITVRVAARPKNIYSLFRKMKRQNKKFEEIQDLAGLRLITDTVEHCYALLGVIHTQFTPVEGSFTDYIALPKNNLYQSLHTTVNLSGKEILEIQIRTEDMHRMSEFGLASHWRYKHDMAHERKDSVEDKLDWVKQILEWQQDTANPREFLEGLKIELEFDQVFVFTPKGDVKKLPAGATPVDFAFLVHTDLGFQCVGAKVNGKMSRLDTPLKSGDRCEIQTRKGQKPHKDWLDFVKTPRARSKIRKYLRETEKGGS